MEAAQDAVKSAYVHGFWKGFCICMIANLIADTLIVLVLLI